MIYSQNQSSQSELATQQYQFSRRLRINFQLKLFLFLSILALFIPVNLAIGGRFDWCYWLILLATLGISWEGCKAYQLNPDRFEQQFQRWQMQQK